MSAPDLDVLLEQLKSLKKGSNPREAFAIFDELESKALVACRRQCALCRRFDREVFDLVTSGIPDRASLDEFVQSAPARPLGAGFWTLDDGTRTRLLADWRERQPGDWKEWNRRLGELFAARTGADAHLDALYHLAASPEPSRAVPRFRAWYKEADDRFDLAQCQSLLEILRLQKDSRGAELSQEWQNYTDYYAARMLFLDDYYKTGAFFHRDGPADALKKVIDLDKPVAKTPWIFHLHATGGTGKTMFLRSMLARYLVPSRVPCARVDFDDFANLDDVVKRPIELFLRIVSQWAVQEKRLNPLLEKLRLEERTAGFNDSVFDEIRRQLVGARIDKPLVVMLDTLEDATISATAWLTECIAQLRRIHADVPNLRLILSGRYDLQSKSTALRPGEYVPFELRRFTVEEAGRYLEGRGIAPGKVLDAIVARATSEADDEELAADDPYRYNPFKLAIFAEIALNRGPALTSQEVLDLPSADVAYLLERVVLRIKSQPLRWVVRYGVIARHLTADLVGAVLMPPLRGALRGGRPADDPGEFAKVWEPQPELADTVTVTDIWDQLKPYARERGWISLVESGSRSELRFHPEVVQPMRDLLRGQPIYADLQAAAVSFFESRAHASDSDDGTDDAVRPSVRARCEAVFHRYQLDGPAARDYWSEQVRAAEALGPAQARVVAAEITGKDYTKNLTMPLPGITTAETLIAAHCAAADLSLQAAGIDFSARHSRWPEFARHVQLAESIESQQKDSKGLVLRLVPAMLRTIRDAYRESAASAVVRLRRALELAPSVRERVTFEIRLADRLALLHSAEAAVHFKTALMSLDETLRTGVRPLDLHLWLAALYVRSGSHVAVVDAHRQALIAAGADPNARAQVLEEQAAYALGARDIAGASANLKELCALPEETHRSPAAVPLLTAAIALAHDDFDAARKAAAEAARHASTDLDRAESHERMGDAHAMVFAFGAALGAWESAASAYDSAGSSDSVEGLTESGWCTLKTVRLKTVVMGLRDEHGTILEAASRLRSVRNPGLASGLTLLQVFADLRMDRKSAAHGKYRTLLDQSAEWTARLRAEILLFGLLFGLLDANALSEEIVLAVSDVYPLTRRTALLEWSEHAGETIDVPPGLVERLLPLFSAPRIDSASTVASYVGRADLCRILGKPDEAVAQLARLDQLLAAGTIDRGLLQHWNVNQARKRLGQPTQFGAFVSRVAGSAIENTPLHGAMRYEEAAEALRNQEFGIARDIVARGFAPLDAEIDNVWHGRIAELRKALEEADAPRPAASSGPNAALAQTPHTHVPFASGQSVVEIDAPAVPSYSWTDQTGSIERLIDLLLGGWWPIANDLSSCLHAILPPGEFLGQRPIAPHGGLAMLPWELMPQPDSVTPVWRSVAQLRTPWPPAPLHRPGSVHLVLPEQVVRDLDYTQTSGESLETLYAFRFHVRPAVAYNPHPEQLEVELIKSAATLVHIVAALRESNSGVYLDFEGASTRIGDIAQRSPDRSAAQLLLNVSWLDRVLSRLSPPPFVILDIARPENAAEAIRMLLLRNIFATQLFQLGHVRGILGMGLAPPHQRLPLATLAIEALIERIVIQALAALRMTEPAYSPAMSLDDGLSRFCAALWAGHGDDSIFGA